MPLQNFNFFLFGFKCSVNQHYSEALLKYSGTQPANETFWHGYGTLGGSSLGINWFPNKKNI